MQDADRVTGEVVEIYLPLAQAADHLINPRRWRLADYSQAAHGVFDTFGDAVEWFDSTAQVIRGCIRIANGSHRHEEAWKLTESLSGWLHIRKDWQVWKISHEMAEESARHCGAAAHARMLAALGEYHLWQEQTALAEAYLQRARARWTEAEHVLGRAFCLEALGALEMKKDSPEKARVLVTEARDLFAAAGRERGVVLMSRRIGETYRHQGDYCTAQEHLKPAYRWFEEDGDLYQQVRTGRSLALALEGLGRADEAQQLLLDLSRLAESIGAEIDAEDLRRLVKGTPHR